MDRGAREHTGRIGRVTSINRSKGGVPKTPVPEVWVTASGLEGDAQRRLAFHGGPERAVSLFALERIEALQREGHPIVPGSTGENLTVTGLDWSAIVPGTRLRVGEVELVVTSYAVPCRVIQGSFADHRFSRMSEKTHPGWSRVYARVEREGMVRVGDVVTALPPGAGA